jgi:urea carboxylase-associated protein 2
MSLWEDYVQPGASWSLNLKRGNRLRLTDVEGAANVAALFYNRECPSERYNMPDSLKAQHTAHLTAGHALYSDMGRVLCSITGDTCGWHDPLCGYTNRKSVAAKYGEASYQHHRNQWHRNTLDNLLTEASRHGLGIRDLGPTVNFFSKVVVGPDGGMHFAEAHSKAGDFVELRAEMNLLVILDTGQHPLDPNPRYAPKLVRIEVLHGEPGGPDDACRTACPENNRGFINTERYFL